MWSGHIALPLTGSHPSTYSSFSFIISKKSQTFTRTSFKHVKFSKLIMLSGKSSFYLKKKHNECRQFYQYSSFLKVFKHSSNFCKILFFKVLNLMLELFIKFTHQISAVINCFFSIIIYILTIKRIWIVCQIPAHHYVPINAEKTTFI